jgi:hypothetical protein
MTKSRKKVGNNAKGKGSGKETNEKIKNMRVYGRYSNSKDPTTLHPQIILEGKYLQEYGFTPNSELRITLNQGKIMIEKE